MITWDLYEKKLSELGKVGKLSDLQKAAHSQGIDLGEPTKNAHHVDYPDAKFRKGGAPARTRDGKAIGGSAKGDKISNATHATKLRDAVLASGRVDKRPAAKEERKKEAAENKARKAKNRDPFTREHSEWWVDMWRNGLLEATVGDLKRMGASPDQIRKLQQRQAQRGKGFETGDDRANQKALPPSKGSAIVRQKRGGTDKEAVGMPRKSGPGVREPEQRRPPSAERRVQVVGGALAKRPKGGEGFGEPVPGDWEKGPGLSDKEKEEKKKEDAKKREKRMKGVKKQLGRGVNLLRKSSESSHSDADSADTDIKGPNIKNQAD